MASKVNVDQEKKNLLSKINRLTDSGELNEESENKIGRVKDELSAKIERIGDDLNVAPSHFCVINKKLGDELQRLLNIIKDINNEFVGYSTLDAIIQIGSDHEYQENQANLYKWAKDFINDRLRKKNPKDKNNELLKYQRLISETDDLEDIRAVNGFNHDFEGWGREDSELVVRLFKYGLKRKENPFKAICFHLWHHDNKRNCLEKNDRILKKVMESESFFCKSGLNELV